MDGNFAQTLRAAGLRSSEDTLWEIARYARVSSPTVDGRSEAFWQAVKKKPEALDALISTGMRKQLWLPYEKALGGASAKFDETEGRSKSAPDDGGHLSSASVSSMPVTEFGEGEGHADRAPQDGGHSLHASSSPEPDVRDAHIDRDDGGQERSASEGHPLPAPSVSTPSAVGGQCFSALDEGQGLAAPAADTSSPAGGRIGAASDKGHVCSAPAGAPLKPVWPAIHSPPDGPRPSAVRYSTPPSLRPARPPVQRMPQAHQRRPEVQASKGDTWFRKLDIDIEGKRIGDRRVGDLLRIFDNTQGNWHRSRRAYESQIEDAKSQIKSAERSIAFKDQKEAFVRKLIELAGLKPDDFITERNVTAAHIKAAWTYAEELYSAKAA